ncbi:hypothetical protein INT43_002691 [Umbelopsis isabellina]|uniref:Uncharacterized protein n=1 Tax=Mortierella isabellina TaxID=91625 RepID=A0A8H7Q6N9_MORIS|nr:hypothetical protein INT43_002691 [Umbelopsis isabellina]
MFLTKLLQGSRSPKAEPSTQLRSAWRCIVQYYESTQDPLNDLMSSTGIPSKLQKIASLLCQEEADETFSGCFQFIFENRILEELAEFAKADVGETPYGMRTQCLRFFATFVTHVPAGELHTRSLCVPLQKLIQSSHRVISHHYDQLADKRIEKRELMAVRRGAISEVSLELVALLRAVISRLRDSKALMDVLFERGWCSGLGEKVWKEKTSQDNRIHMRSLSTQEKLAWNVFIQPRFTMFSMLLDFINTPGETSEIAREAVLFALRLVDNDPEFLCYIVEYSGFAEILVFTLADRLAMIFSATLGDISMFSWAPNCKLAFMAPVTCSLQSSVPQIFSNTNIYPSLNAPCSGKRRRRHYCTFDLQFWKLLSTQNNQEAITDEFFALWEYLNDIMRQTSPILSASIGYHLYHQFWQPVLCSTLSSAKSEITRISTVRITEMVRSLKDRNLQHLFMVFLLGENGGGLLDHLPETQSKKVAKKVNGEGTNCHPSVLDPCESRITLRQLLINRIIDEDEALSLATMHLFDTILETHNQFVIHNLLLRNYGVDRDDIAKKDASNDNGHKEKRSAWLVGSLLPCEKQVERRDSTSSIRRSSFSNDRASNENRRMIVTSPIPSVSSKANSSNCDNSLDASSVLSDATTMVDCDEIYYIEALEKWNYSRLTNAFWNDDHQLFKQTERQKGDTATVHPAYEGSFLAALFDAADKVCEIGIAKSLMLTRLLAKVANISDERIDWIMCNWSNIPNDDDESSYDEYEKNCEESSYERRTLLAVMEKVTFDALKRARTIPQFETKLRAARNGCKSTTDLFHIGQNLTENARSDGGIYKSLSRRTSFTQLLFSTVNSPPSTPSPSECPLPPSPTSAFFQYPPTRPNSTPVTLTNPFAKLPEFLTGYIILQEFCKEIAAIAMVKYIVPYEINALRNQNRQDVDINCVHPLEMNGAHS